MIRDNDLIFSDSQAVTVSAASTDIVDLTKKGDAIGTELYLAIQCREAAAAAGAATVNFVLQTATDAAFTTPVVLFDSGAIAKASITLNAFLVKVKIPVGLLQFVRVYYTVGTGPLTAGKFDAFLTPDVPIS